MCDNYKFEKLQYEKDPARVSVHVGCAWSLPLAINVLRTVISYASRVVSGAEFVE